MLLKHGKGNYTQCSPSDPLCVPAKDRKPIFAKVFQEGKRYLLRLINASTESGFIFSIDNHLLEIIDTDFVPIHPFKNESIHIAIGEPSGLRTKHFLIVARSEVHRRRRGAPVCSRPSGWQLLDSHYCFNGLRQHH